GRTCVNRLDQVVDLLRGQLMLSRKAGQLASGSRDAIRLEIKTSLWGQVLDRTAQLEGGADLFLLLEFGLLDCAKFPLNSGERVEAGPGLFVLGLRAGNRIHQILRCGIPTTASGFLMLLAERLQLN